MVDQQLLKPIVLEYGLKTIGGLKPNTKQVQKYDEKPCCPSAAHRMSHRTRQPQWPKGKSIAKSTRSVKAEAAQRHAAGRSFRA